MMDISILVNLIYIAASILFIVGLKMLGSPDTARQGNFLSSSGMLIAVVITLLDQSIIDYRFIAGALLAGSVVGYFAATKVQMTSMPEMVAIFNGFGGIASLLVGSAEYVVSSLNNPALMGAIYMTVLIGGLTFTGSLVAYGKLSEVISGKPFLYKGQQFVDVKTGRVARRGEVRLLREGIARGDIIGRGLAGWTKRYPKILKFMRVPGLSAILSGPEAYDIMTNPQLSTSQKVARMSGLFTGILGSGIGAVVGGALGSKVPGIGTLIGGVLSLIHI